MRPPKPRSPGRGAVHLPVSIAEVEQVRVRPLLPPLGAVIDFKPALQLDGCELSTVCVVRGARAGTVS